MLSTPRKTCVDHAYDIFTHTSMHANVASRRPSKYNPTLGSKMGDLSYKTVFFFLTLSLPLLLRNDH